MKKKLFVGLTMMMLIIISLISTASAENTSTSGTQTITINAELPTWELEIPADVNIPFGTTSATSIGLPKITNVSPTTFYKGWIRCFLTHSGNFTGTGGGTGTASIPYTLKDNRDYEIIAGHRYCPVYYTFNGRYDAVGDVLISVTENDWSKAPLGSYEATITYSSSYDENYY